MRVNFPPKSLLFSFIVCLPLSLGVAGCGGDDDQGSNGCFDYSSFNGTSPAVHFQANVLPIFQNSCGLSTSCHGDSSSPSDRPYLGPNKMTTATSTDIDAIFTAIVGKPALKEPSMKIVEVGNPQKSFLMHKLDGVTCSDLACASSGTCGAQMPTGAPLAQGDRDTIRRWIAQGAKKD